MAVSHVWVFLRGTTAAEVDVVLPRQRSQLVERLPILIQTLGGPRTVRLAEPMNSTKSWLQQLLDPFHQVRTVS
jgi:hypothetical protein